MRLILHVAHDEKQNINMCDFLKLKVSFICASQEATKKIPAKMNLNEKRPCTNVFLLMHIYAILKKK